ncbi:unnamed protein product [Prunus armeniaca]
MPQATVPTRRHTRRQRLGVQSDIASPENFQIESQDSYPSGRNRDRNTGRNPIRKSSCLHYKLINFYPTGSQSSENRWKSIPQSLETVAGGGRSIRRSFKRKPAKNLHFPATGAAADVGEGPGHDTGAEPVILAPVPSASVAGGRSCEGGGRQLSRGGEREHPREREFSDFIQNPFRNIYDYATEGILIVSLSSQLQFEPTTCLRTHLTALYATDRVITCSSQSHREHFAHQGVVCLVQDHGALEVPQMALRVRVPFNEVMDGVVNRFGGGARSTSSVKGKQSTRSISLHRASSVLPLSRRPRSWSFTSFSTSSARRVESRAERLRCLERD